MNNFKDALSACYNPKTFFADIAERLQAGDKIILEEIITGKEDAWLNSLISSVDMRHIRYHRAEDIIAAAGDYFTLLSYERKPEQISFMVTNIKLIKEQLSSFTNIAQMLQAELSGDKLSLIVQRGRFCWSC